MKYKLYQGDCLERLAKLDPVTCIFADPPDNIGLGYDEYDDNRSNAEYEKLLYQWIEAFTDKADIVWLSFNAKWTATVGAIIHSLIGANNPLGDDPDNLEFKPCVQVFTFGQHRNSDLGNNHRPLWRIKRRKAKLYPEAIKVPSWRQRNGDKRAAKGGRVPGDVFDHQYPQPVDPPFEIVESPVIKGIFQKAGPNFQLPPLQAVEIVVNSGTVFDFPRVTGNSAQRCDWHPTQLHEELVERCIKLSTTDGDTVLDPFGGTGTTLRVCERLERDCTLIELDEGYCAQIKKAHKLKTLRTPGAWGK
jgi:site-specific DNA-methyltransferase (adenine-specific)